MNWDVGVKVGDDDSFSCCSQGHPVLDMSFGRPKDPSAVRENVLNRMADTLNSAPGGTATDLLRVAITVYCADMLISREYAVDGWARHISVHLPVAFMPIWLRAKPLLIEMLGFLSGDHWEFSFRDLSTPWRENRRVMDNRPDVVSLFSGGIDSLVGAIDLLSEGKKLVLVSHYGVGSIGKSQGNVLERLKEEYEDQITALRCFVLPPIIRRQGSSRRNENTTRTRSFLFLALGIAVADAIGEAVPLSVAENGFVSLNVPLTLARLGSHSTRTTHPYYISLFRRVLETLDLDHPLSLDYRFKTKGQMLAQCKNQTLLRRALPHSVSCAHPDNRRHERRRPGGHCGYCFPCIIRQAAAFASGMPDAQYDYDVLNLTLPSRSDRQRDLRAVEMAVQRFRQKGENKAVFDVLSSGPIPHDELSDCAAVYCRGINEISSYLGSNHA